MKVMTLVQLCQEKKILSPSRQVHKKTYAEEIIAWKFEMCFQSRKSFIIISDCLHHDAVAVYVYLKAFNEYLSEFLPHITHLIYFSDGAPPQFKNFKHLLNLLFHENDFKRTVMWHFQVTAHGKGPCNGLRAVLKRGATLACLAPGGTLITTPKELYEWAKQDSNLPNITVYFKNRADYEVAEKFLTSRYETFNTTPETQKLYCVEPKTNCVLYIDIRFGHKINIHFLIYKIK